MPLGFPLLRLLLKFPSRSCHPTSSLYRWGDWGLVWQQVLSRIPKSVQLFQGQISTSLVSLELKYLLSVSKITFPTNDSCFVYSESFFFFFLWYHMNFRIVFSFSVKCATGIFLARILNLNTLLWIEWTLMMFVVFWSMSTLCQLFV